MGDEEPATCTGPGCCSSPPRGWCWPTAWTCSASARRSGCRRRARTRGGLGPRRGVGPRARPGCAARRRQRARAAAVVGHRPQGRRRGARGRRGRPPRPGRASTARRRTSSTRRTSAPAPAPSATPSPTTTSSTPARRSCAPTVARWVAEEGLSPRRVHRRGADRRAERPASTGAGRLPRQQQVRRRAAAGRRGRAWAGSSSTPSTRSSGSPRSPREIGPRPPRVMVRVTAGVEAHTHEYIATAHEDQKFGFSISRRRRVRGGAAGRTAPRAGPARAAQPHRVADLRHRGVRGGRAPGARAARADLADELGAELPELDLGGGFGIAYTTQDDPAEPARARRGAHRRSSSTSAAALGWPCRGCRSSPGGRSSGPAMCTALRGRHGQGRRARRRRASAPTSPSTAG